MMLRFRSSIHQILLVLSILFGLAGRGSAQSDDAFRKHYDQAVRLYESSDYEAAVREFQAAYTIKQLPRLLLNIGQAHRKLGHARDALGFYEFYLRVELHPKPEIKAELEIYIKQTREMLAAAERMKLLQAAAERDRRKEPPAALIRPDLTLAALDPAPPGPAGVARPAAVAAPGKKASRPPLYRRWWLWTTVGVVAAGTVAAVVAGTYHRGQHVCPFSDGDDC